VEDRCDRIGLGEAIDRDPQQVHAIQYCSQLPPLSGTAKGYRS
jgi:hypothetical protein